MEQLELEPTLSFAVVRSYMWHLPLVTSHDSPLRSREMSEDHFDQYEHYNFDQDKQIFTGHGGRSSPQLWCDHLVLM